MNYIFTNGPSEVDRFVARMEAAGIEPEGETRFVSLETMKDGMRYTSEDTIYLGLCLSQVARNAICRTIRMLHAKPKIVTIV